MSLRTSVTVTSFLILVMNIFSGHSLTCHRAEYQIGNECCPKCLPGSRVKIDCTEFRSTSCLTCLKGTFMNQPTGLKHCFICTNCDSDSGETFVVACSSLSTSVWVKQGKKTDRCLIIGQVSPAAAKVQVSLDFPAPQTRPELLGFLGMVGYYRAFCKNFSAVAAALTSLVPSHFVYSDHNPLVFRTQMQNNNHRLMRWSLLLRDFNVEIHSIRFQVIPWLVSRYRSDPISRVLF
ncbi:hypothetical protein Q8A73_014442 [Channa argus]|nr:hypothetical protein Q8A73_014442 [Channa argus]